MFFFPLTKAGRARHKTAQLIYKSCVDQARSVEFYRDARVPDTLTGRFDMIALHVGLVVTLCQSKGKAGEALAQSIFDVMFVNLDQTCREIGIGDLSVPRHIKRMMTAFKGRALAFDQAIAQGDDVLKDTIVRNLYAGNAPENPLILNEMCSYIRKLYAHISQLDYPSLMDHGIQFPFTPEFSHESTQRDVA
jgi:cytochrome b pre-mRNA-processing protein 3